MNTAPFVIYEAKSQFPRGHITSLVYCHTSGYPKIFSYQWELSNEVLYKDFPQGASELPKDKVLDF